MRPGRYDEMAILALTEDNEASVIDRVLGYRDRLRGAKPRPSKDLAFSLAAGIELARDTDRAAARGVGDFAALQSIRAILDAQQAAMAGAIAASSAAAHSSGG